MRVLFVVLILLSAGCTSKSQEAGEDAVEGPLSDGTPDTPQSRQSEPTDTSIQLAYFQTDIATEPERVGFQVSVPERGATQVMWTIWVDEDGVSETFHLEGHTCDGRGSTHYVGGGAEMRGVCADFDAGIYNMTLVSDVPHLGYEFTMWGINPANETA